ncbi:MAG: hypothetical protein CFE21_00390 [Bacteroidetes bacterium B1(2017)]|nr:MAG: hypothetical protein CFE21_00390 [Bacteroidetes bacterium B1(2017)]
MQNLVFHKKGFLFLFVLGTFVLLNGCEKELAPVRLLRFEQDLFDTKTVSQPDHFYKLQKKYGYYYDSYCKDVLNISEEESAEAFQPSMSKFVSIPSILQLKHEVDSVFPNTTQIEQELSEAMAIYIKEFPDKKVPTFITYLSEFTIANTTYDSIIGIGLDFYLGSNYPLYPALEFPEFMVAKLRREYLIANTIKAMAIGRYEQQLKDKRFLAMMLFEGKVRYFMKQLLPTTPDSLIFGYSAKQVQWAKENEAMIWAHLVENKLLFNADPSTYMRYFNDGPFTIASGVPQESSPAIGIYAGYKIIENYMKENSSVSLKELMGNGNWDELLKESKYKPK